MKKNKCGRECEYCEHNRSIYNPETQKDADDFCEWYGERIEEAEKQQRKRKQNEIKKSENLQ